MFEAQLDFSGCSCGCTPYERVEIRADSQEDLDRACVLWALDFRVEGGRPFYKVSGIPPSAEDLCKKAITLLEERDELRTEWDKEVWEKNRILSEVQEIRQAAVTLGIDVPEHSGERIREIEMNAASHDSVMEGLRQRIDDVTRRLDGLLRNDAEVIHPQYDDDEEE